jgi:hypothetical protein
MRVVLDQRAVDALTQKSGPAERRVRQVMRAAQRLGRDVMVPAVILAELYRGGGRNHLVDSLLSCENDGLQVRDTDRTLARLVGAVLSVAEAGSEDLADAHVVAVAAEAGGGIVVTGDPVDMLRLSAPYRTVVVEALPSR